MNASATLSDVGRAASLDREPWWLLTAVWALIVWNAVIGGALILAPTAIKSRTVWNGIADVAARHVGVLLIVVAVGLTAGVIVRGVVLLGLAMIAETVTWAVWAIAYTAAAYNDEASWAGAAVCALTAVWTASWLAVLNEWWTGRLVRV